MSEEAILLISVAKSVIGDLSLTDLLKNVYDAEWIDPKSGVSKKLNNLESVDGESPPIKGNLSSFQAIEEKIMSSRFLFSVSERKATGVEYFRVKSLMFLTEFYCLKAVQQKQAGTLQKCEDDLNTNIANGVPVCQAYDTYISGYSVVFTNGCNYNTGVFYCNILKVALDSVYNAFDTQLTPCPDYH
ncbi:unnamed protein product, partial [Mesorhabditis belari]|uniref:Uncharacterized protein n=1 Tax=Mesorhabditis belari TaxID=2138241 RepID=A0AAF3F1N6_9BILA